MTLLETLQSRRGGLIRLKSELHWYDGQGWDRSPGRLCLILDATAATFPAAGAVVAATTGATAIVGRAAATVLLLIDGSPRWIWVDEADVELIDGGDQ